MTSLSQVSAGNTILAAHHNEVYNLLKGVANGGEGITLVYSAAGVIIFQPSSDPGAGTQLFQIKNSAGTVQSALTSDGALILGAIPATVGTARLPNAGSIQFRNAANNGDVNVLSFDASNNLSLQAGTGTAFISFNAGGNEPFRMNPTYTTFQKQYYAAKVANGNSGTAATVDWNSGNVQAWTMTGNCVFTLSNPQSGARYVLFLTQDGTGARTYTWPAAVHWSGGTAPTGSAAGKVDVVSLAYEGSIYAATAALNF